MDTPVIADAPVRKRRRPVIAFGFVLLGTFVGLLGAEAFVRIARPAQRANVVRLSTLRTIDGDPVWEHSADRQNRACAEKYPERQRIVLLGSSITYGFQLALAEVFTSQLEQRLNAARPSPGFCVMSFAQPGFTSKEKFATAREALPRYRPVLVLWEGWNEFGGFVKLGEGAYELRHHVLRADGFPGLAGVPDTINRTLFLNSKLYQYATLQVGETKVNNDEFEPARKRLAALAALARSVGSRLAAYEAVSMDRPFEAPHLQSGILEEFVVKEHVPLLRLSEALTGQDYKVLRLGDCCHFNAAGHRVLAPLFERFVLSVLDGPAF